jgi:hypothetical protein
MPANLWLEQSPVGNISPGPAPSADSGDIFPEKGWGRDLCWSSPITGLPGSAGPFIKCASHCLLEYMKTERETERERESDLP